MDYDPTTTQEWLSEVDSWSWEKIGADKWRKTGPCPRCGHLISRVVMPEVLVIGNLPGVEGTIEVTTIASKVFIECNCNAPHDGRPDGESGCGPAGLFSGPPDWED